MSPILGKASRRRAVIATWAILWMLMAPLFHVHPGVNHHHGDAGHVHNGIVHAVFSSDLAYEHTAHVHDSSFLETDHQHFQASGPFGHAFSHSEIAFSFLGVSNDHSIGKPDHTVAGLPEIGSPPLQRVVVTPSSPPFISPVVLFLSTALPLRAPPSPSI